MKRPVFIARQSARPTGLLGRVIGSVMAFETEPANALAVEILEPQSGDRLLEIGFGPGETLRRLVRATGDQGEVHGVDSSGEMVRMAKLRNARSVEAGRVILLEADASRLPYPDSHFDRVLSVHTVYFWREPLVVLQEALRVLKPGGRLVLGFRHDAGCARSFPASVYNFRGPDEVNELLRSAGFVLVRTVSRLFGQCQLYFAVAQRRLE